MNIIGAPWCQAEPPTFGLERLTLASRDTDVWLLRNLDPIRLTATAVIQRALQWLHIAFRLRPAC